MSIDVEQAEQTLAAAQDALAAATADALQAEHIAELLAQPGLTYGDVGVPGEVYVAYSGAPLGFARQEPYNGSPLLNWWAYPLGGDRLGPFVMARPAAAALLRRHVAAA